MQPESIFSIICDTRQKIYMNQLFRISDSFLYDHEVGCDHANRTIFITAETRPNCLDKGSGPTAISHYAATHSGIIPEDQPAQFIGQCIGGDGGIRNVFALNKRLDTNAWRADERLVYEYLKQGGNRRAHLMYAVQYNEIDGETGRPEKIYYYFQLYENGAIFGQPIAGVFENLSPKLTNPELFKNPDRISIYYKDSLF